MVGFFKNIKPNLHKYETNGLLTINLIKMKRSLLVKTGSNLLGIGIILYIIQNTYFGWNELPMSRAEEITDTIIKVIVYGGWFIYLIPIFTLYEESVKKLDS